MTTSEISQTDSGMYSLYILDGSNRLLPLILNRDIPWVWVFNHLPNTQVGWWDTQLPLSKTGATIPVRARNVSFDLVIETARFIDVHKEFFPHGMVLCQSTMPMPDTLLTHGPSGLSTGISDRVLKQNGVFLQFSLPHEYETCEVKCWDRDYLEKVKLEVSRVQD